MLYKVVLVMVATIFKALTIIKEKSSLEIYQFRTDSKLAEYFRLIKEQNLSFWFFLYGTIAFLVSRASKKTNSIRVHNVILSYINLINIPFFL